MSNVRMLSESTMVVCDLFIFARPCLVKAGAVNESENSRSVVCFGNSIRQHLR